MFIRLRDEEGSSLILALVFLSLFGVFVAALLTFVDSSFRTTTAVRERGAAVYEADAAVEGAIQSIRPYVGQGVFNALCNSFSYGTAINGVPVRVECEGLSGSGTTGDPGGVTPPAAVITTSTQDPSTVPPAQQVHGFHLESQTEATIDGGILSASTIRLDNQSKLSVPAGKASARLTCSIGGGAQLLPPSSADCPTTLTGSDPGYPLPPGSAPSVTATLPGCGAGPVVVLPGNRKYTNQTALENLLRCGTRIFWFQPGIHYFEFTTGDPDLYLQGNQASSSVYVAGTPLGWNPADPTVTPAALRTLSNAGSSLCDNVNMAAPGAQFIFGGTSRFGMKDGVFEICAPNDQPAAKVAIYGVKTTTRGYTALTGCTTQIGDCTGDVKALIHTDVPGGVGNPMTFKAHGTVYAPTASLLVRLPAAGSTEVFDRGVIVRTFRVAHTNSSGLAGFRCSTGDPQCQTGRPSNRRVTFTACPASAATPCPAGERLLRAEVQFEDDGGLSPGHTVTVLSWSVLR